MRNTDGHEYRPLNCIFCDKISSLMFPNFNVVSLMAWKNLPAASEDWDDYVCYVCADCHHFYSEKYGLRHDCCSGSECYKHTFLRYCQTNREWYCAACYDKTGTLVSTFGY